MGSGGTSVDYQMSPEQRQLLTSISPLFQGLANYGVNNMTYGNPADATNLTNKMFGNGVPPPQAPSFSSGGGWSPVNDMIMQEGKGGFNPGYMNSSPSTGNAQKMAYDQYMNEYKNYVNNFSSSSPVTSLYDQPSAPMPTAGWYNSIAPEVMQGLWEPYNDAAGQMAETLNMQGSLGSGGRYTGNAMGNFGDFYSKAGTQIGTQAWNMMSPGMIQNYNAQMAELTAPYQLLGMTPSLMPTGIVQNQPNTGGNVAMGAASGALAGSAAGPYGAVIGGIGGALAGLMQG